MESGKDLATNLNDLYIYCSNTLQEYLEEENEKIVRNKRYNHRAFKCLG